MAVPLGVLTWEPSANTREVDLVTSASLGDTSTNSNHNHTGWNNIDTVDLAGTEWQAVIYWDEDEHLVISVRQDFGSWTHYVYDGVAETPEITRQYADNHNNCRCAFDSDGVLHISYNNDSSTLLYRKTTTAISSFTGTLTSTGTMVHSTAEASATYPTFFRDPLGVLYFIFRFGDSGNGDLYWYTYSTGSGTWSAASGTSTNGLLIQGRTGTPTHNPYWHGPPLFTSDWDGAGTGYAYFAWTWRPASGGLSENRDPSFVRWNGSTFSKTTGSQTVPITLANAEIVDSVGTTVELASFNTMVIDSSGNPHLFHGRLSSSLSRIMHAYHNGSSWSVTALDLEMPSYQDGSQMDWQYSTIDAVIDGTDTIHLVVVQPDGIGPGVYAFTSDGTNWNTETWTMKVLTHGNVDVINGTGTDMGPTHDVYQWEVNGLYQMLVPLAAESQTTISDPDLSDGIIAYWSLEGDFVDEVAALTPTNNNSTPFVAAKVGDGADFESSSSQSATLATNSTVAFGDVARTFVAWVKPEATSGNRTIFSKWGGANNEYLLYLPDGGNEPLWLIRDSGGSTVGSCQWAGNAGNGVWRHVIADHDPTSNTMNMWVDNSASPRTVSTSGTPFSGSSDFSIGSTNGTANYMDGVIDEGIIYDRLLNSLDRFRLFNFGDGLSYSDITGGGGGTAVPALTLLGVG